jgi:transcriptional regulator with XRE-family HTH domain
VHKQRYYLKEWREERGLSQPKLAAKTDEGDAGVDIRTIQNIEAEPNSIRQGRVIRVLEKALDLPPGGLKEPPSGTQKEEPPPSKELEDRLKGRVTIDVNGVEVELTEEEKAKILAMAKILKGGA